MDADVKGLAVVGPQDQGQVDSLQRGLEVLRLFDSRHKHLSASEIAAKLGLTRATTLKLLSTLTSANFLRFDSQRDAFEPHVACLALGRAARRGLEVVRVAAPLMRQLTEVAGVQLYLSTRDRLHMLVLEHCTPPGQEESTLGTGARLPIAPSASGRAYLWAQKPAQQAELIELLKAANQESVYRFMPGVYAAFQELEEQGWCFVPSPITHESNSIAAPVHLRGSSEFVVAAMSVGTADSEQNLREVVGPQLLRVCAQIGRSLDGTLG
ncbi:helix-turn-helix domain-containing protein [Cupriavidus sp. U2]|uniref:IclR family transcriptional regulator n=1 Tax=Cupriavidus sp. U2 TaxID=2920269 RepID=UPI00129ED415|nr:helix-turn-helix domain-containing protein [Cupriavidus sp. U2]